MKKIKRRTYSLLVFLGALAVCLMVFLFNLVTEGRSWATFPSNKSIYSNGVLAAGSIYDRNGVLLSGAGEEGRIFADESAVRHATLHVVGDGAGGIGTGALTRFADRLIGYNLINGTYSFTGAGNNLYLTIDADLNVTAYEALAGRKGTVAVYNYETGEILCNVSTPTYDPAEGLDIPEDDERYEGVYINRFLSSAYTPGSVFKLVTTAAAIDTLPGAYDRQYTCGGSTVINGGQVTCTGTHGTIALDEALAVSCNVYFAELSLELGGDVLAAYTEKMGLTGSQSINGISTAAGNFTRAEAGTAELAWSGIGQYEDTVNPAAMLTLMGAVANGGTPVIPRFILKTTTSFGMPTWFYGENKGDALLSGETADALGGLMRNNVLSHYGESAFPGLTVCGKTGTAEVGDGAPHAWFVGFLNDEDNPLAFVVVVENGGSGSSTALPVANTVLQAAVAQ